MAPSLFGIKCDQGVFVLLDIDRLLFIDVLELSQIDGSTKVVYDCGLEQSVLLQNIAVWFIAGAML